MKTEEAHYSNKLPNDVTRCCGDRCNVRTKCKRYLTIELDGNEGIYSFMFFSPKNCKDMIPVAGYKSITKRWEK